MTKGATRQSRTPSPFDANYRVLLGLHERVRNLLPALSRTDDDDGIAAGDDQAEVARLARHLERVVRIAQVLDAVVEHEVDERVVALEHARTLAPALELHTHILVEVAREVHDRLFLLLL